MLDFNASGPLNRKQSSSPSPRIFTEKSRRLQGPALATPFACDPNSESLLHSFIFTFSNKFASFTRRNTSSLKSLPETPEICGDRQIGIISAFNGHLRLVENTHLHHFLDALVDDGVVGYISRGAEIGRESSGYPFALL